MLEEDLPRGTLLRVVNNLPWRPLGQAERDGLIEARVKQALRRFQPDVVHVVVGREHLAGRQRHRFAAVGYDEELVTAQKAGAEGLADRSVGLEEGRRRLDARVACEGREHGHVRVDRALPADGGRGDWY